MPAKHKQPLSITHPELALEWHPTKNRRSLPTDDTASSLFPETRAELADPNLQLLSPADVVAGSKRKVWWKCPHGPDHEWEATIAARTCSDKSGCPYCSGYKFSVTNSLASRFPEIAAEWHPTKNGDLTPEQVTAGSHRKFWWKCPMAPDHEWQATLNNRTGKKSGCPCCSCDKVSITNSLAVLFPEIAAQWHPTENGHLAPDDVVAGSHKKVWWRCPKGEDHEWEATIGRRTSREKKGCPFCSGHKVSVSNSLALRFPAIAAEWHPTRNGDLTPAKVTAGSNKKFWWKCPNDDDHAWHATICSTDG